MAAYGTDPGFADWLTARGLTVTGNLGVLRQLASDYFDATYCFLPTDTEGANFLAALYRAAYLADTNPGILTPVQTGARVKRQKVDVIEREFFDDGADSVAFTDPTINGLMRLFICADANNPFIFESIGSSCLGEY